MVRTASLYFYFDEPHQRPHVDVVGPGWDVKIDLVTFMELDRSGSPPRAALRDVERLLRQHQEAAIAAFHATREHRFPGTLKETSGEVDDG